MTPTSNPATTHLVVLITNKLQASLNGDFWISFKPLYFHLVWYPDPVLYTKYISLKFPYQSSWSDSFVSDLISTLISQKELLNATHTPSVSK